MADGYLNLTGASGTYWQTPDHASFDIAGDHEIRMDMLLGDGDWSPGSGGNQGAISRWNAVGQHWAPSLSQNGQPNGFWKDTTTANIQTGYGNAFTVSDRAHWRLVLDADNDAGGYQFDVYERQDYTKALTDDTGWVSVRSVTGGATTDIITGAGTIQMPGHTNGTVNLPDLGLRVYQMMMWDGFKAAGTLLIDPDFRSTSQGDWSTGGPINDDVGRSWSGTGAGWSYVPAADPVNRTNIIFVAAN